jgi:8-oxo-dGTP diphosphatase
VTTDKGKFCSHCGSVCRLETIEGKSREVCPSCGMIFYEQWKVSAGARIVQGDRLLLVQRKFDPWAGCWHMPAGYVEKGEDPLHAAERETMEETGLQVKAQRIVDVYLDHEDPRGEVLVIIFNCEVLGGTLMQTVETLDARYFQAEEIRSLSLAGVSAEQSVQDWLTGRHESNS